MIIRKRDLKGLARSFSYAFKGIAYCVNNERNMRIHLTATVVITLFGILYGLTAEQFIPLIFCYGIVITAEAINTSLEAVVNLASPRYSHFARIAKDTAAGAVLVVSVAAALIGGILFLSDISRFLNTLLFICTSYIWLPIFLVLAIVGTLFVFNGPRLYGEKTTRVYKQDENFDDE